MPRYCIEINCETRASFNKSSESTGIYCKEHIKTGMVNVVEKRKCQFLGCNSRPIYNKLGKNIGIYCNEHKEENMIDVINKKCQYLDCDKQPVYNILGKNTGLYCKEHKEDNMVNVIEKRKCQYLGCNIRPCYNTSGEKKGIFCSEHKEIDMIDVVNKRCQYLGCESTSRCFNKIGEIRGIFCFNHKETGMIDVVNKKCIECNEVQVYNLQYRNHCTRCFVHKFPEEKISRNYKIKEQCMVDFIQETYAEIAFTFDKKVGACSKRRPDAFIDLLTHVLIIECDENQHGSYNTSCENSRTMELFVDFNNRPIVFIRFNPDTYTVDGKKTLSSFKIHRTIGTRSKNPTKRFCYRQRAQTVIS
jgi:hypothetical protein